MMDDNEKAASFIGWKPEQPCLLRDGQYLTTDDPDHPDDSDRCLRFWICKCGARMPLPPANDPATWGLGPNILHAIACPDMSDPRNYMKALEMRDVDARVGCTVWHNHAGWHVDLGMGTTIKEIAPTIGEAAVKMLAALYDAEHAGVTEAGASAK